MDCLFKRYCSPLLAIALGSEKVIIKLIQRSTKGDTNVWQAQCSISSLETTHYRFLLVGYNKVVQNLDDRAVQVAIPKSDRIPVQQGDFIGR